MDRSYHIFYHLLQGGSEELLNQLFLLDENGKRLSKDVFAYLKNGCENNAKKHIDDVGLFKSLLEMLSKELGFTAEEQFTIFRIVAAILHIGNMTINASKYDESKSTISIHIKTIDNPCIISNVAALEKAAALLGCPSSDLEKEITFRGAVMDSARVACRPIECASQRDSLAKSLYNSLFVWLISKINATTLAPELQNSTDINIKTIGLLDIYGFECLQNNDYEQLLINYTNEKLQKLYLNAIFVTEKEMFTEEGLGELMATMTYTDKTSPVIELLDGCTMGKPPGILNKVNDYKRNEDFGELLGSMNRDFNGHTAYAKSFKDKDKFLVKHTAREVAYSASQFIEKNLDKLSDDMKGFMQNKFDPNVANIVKVCL